MHDVKRIWPVVAALLHAPLALAGEAPVIAQVCTSCHLAENGALRGTFEAVAFRSTSIQVRVDDSVEVLRFDPRTLEIVNGARTERPEFLRQVRKENELRVAFVERDGVKVATRITLMPAVSAPAELVIDTPTLARLVAAGPAKRRYALVDARPASRFEEGFIPTARNLPFPSLARHADRLPRDKGELLVFYGTGPTCSMSARSAERARALGHRNVKIYLEGMQGWTAAHPAALTARQLAEAWLGGEMPIVLLDARTAEEAARGHVPGAVVAPRSIGRSALEAMGLPPARARPPIAVYDGGGGAAADAIARQLVAAGYSDVMVLEGGLRAWRAGRHAVATGPAAERVAWAPKPKPGEIPWAEFAHLARAIPADTIVLDVRDEDEVRQGRIPGARNIPEQDLARRLAELPRDKRIVAHCATGVRAEMAYHVLRERGYERVAFLDADVEIDPQGRVELHR